MLPRTYLDHAATTPMRAAAIEAMTAELGRVGNPSSLHASGRAARRVVEESREAIAGCLGARPSEVIFTSGATEADNLVIAGTVGARSGTAGVISTATEHHAVLETLQALQTSGRAQVTLVDVDTDGVVDRDRLRESLAGRRRDLALVTIMWANNETGVVQPMDEITAAAAAADVPVHSDAVQAVGELPIDFASSGLAAMSVSAHKVGGPVGVGALLARRELRMAPIQYGGGQERDLRSGTLDVAGIAGFAAALLAATEELSEQAARLRRLRHTLITGVLALDGTRLNGPESADRSLPGIANVSFAGCQADNLLLLLDAQGIDCSTGSACTAGVSEPSHVLQAMGRDLAEARSALRFSLGHTSTEADVDRLLAVLPDAVERARAAG